MYPVFVLEGPDCAGKTTLAAELRRQAGAEVLHCANRFRGKMVEYHSATMLKALKMSETSPVVLDRWWPSEYVYGNVFRRGAEHPTYWRSLHRVALRYGWVYVWCVPRRVEDYLEFARTVWKKSQEEFPLEMMHAVWELYRDLKLAHYHNFSRPLTQSYDVAADAWKGERYVDWLISFVVQQRGRMSDEAKELMKEPDHFWSGNLHDGPNYLLVADQDPFPWGSEEAWWPMTVPERWETSLMDEALGAKSEVEWLYARPHERVLELIEESDRIKQRSWQYTPTILSSGEESVKLLDAGGIKHRQIKPMSAYLRDERGALRKDLWGVPRTEDETSKQPKGDQGVLI